MNMLVRILLIAFIICVITPAAAQNCQTLEQAKGEAATKSRELGGEVFNLVGKQAFDYLAVVNAVPPVTHLAAPAIMLLAVPNRGAVIGLVFSDHVCIAGRIGAAVHDRALKAALGEDT